MHEGKQQQKQLSREQRKERNADTFKVFFRHTKKAVRTKQPRHQTVYDDDANDADISETIFIFIRLCERTLTATHTRSYFQETRKDGTYLIKSLFTIFFLPVVACSSNLLDFNWCKSRFFKRKNVTGLFHRDIDFFRVIFKKNTQWSIQHFVIRNWQKILRF